MSGAFAAFQIVRQVTRRFQAIQVLLLLLLDLARASQHTVKFRRFSGSPATPATQSCTCIPESCRIQALLYSRLRAPTSSLASSRVMDFSFSITYRREDEQAPSAAPNRIDQPTVKARLRVHRTVPRPAVASQLGTLRWMTPYAPRRTRPETPCAPTKP